MKALLRTILMSFLLGWAVLSSNVVAGEMDLEEMGRQAVATALARLGAAADSENLACLTNAGYARPDGQDTRILFDVIPKFARISLGRGNLLSVHGPPDEPLWFTFIQRKDDAHLPATYVTTEGGRVQASAPLDIHIAKHRSFEPFESVFGQKAFSIVSLANGWADAMPPDLIAGACFHDHFCCGVASGYFTARFITTRLPLTEGERYAYIGAPGWCQDDYLIHYLNLTPGKHGYYTMAYPWARAWKTNEETFSDLGGIVIRFNPKTGQGRADLLRFDWGWNQFKQFLGEPDLELNWKNDSWLHRWYIKYLFQADGSPERFVSVIKSKELKNREEMDALVRLGANPIEAILGKDPSW